MQMFNITRPGFLRAFIFGKNPLNISHIKQPKPQLSTACNCSIVFDSRLGMLLRLRTGDFSGGSYRSKTDKHLYGDWSSTV